MPKPSRAACGSRQPEGVGPIVENALAEVLVESRPLVVEVGDDQVGTPVAVDVAAVDPHPRLVAARAAGGDAGDVADLLESQSAQVSPEEVGRLVVGDVEVHAAVVVDVGGEHPHAAAVGVDDPGLAGDIDEPAAVVAEEMIGLGREEAGVAQSVRAELRIAADEG